MKNTISELKNTLEGIKRRTQEAEANKKSLTKNGKTKKQFPNERKGGSVRKNAN